MAIDIGDGNLYIPPRRTKPVVKTTGKTGGGNGTTGTSSYGASTAGDVTLRGGLVRFRIAAQSFQLQADPHQAQSAQEIVRQRVDDYKGAGNKQDSAEDTGRLIADIAISDPTKANEVANLYLSNDALEDGHRDELAQEAVRSLSDAELRDIASSEDGQKLLTQLQRDLLDPSVHDDEATDADRVRLALDENGIFLGSERGAYPLDNGESILSNENAAPEDVANFIKFSTDDAGRVEFVEALYAHEGDAEWLKEFYSALGSDAAGNLINQTVDIPLNGEDPQFRMTQVGLIRDSLETLQADGVLTDEGMRNLVEQLNSSNSYVASEIFGNSFNPELREMFVSAAISMDTDNWDAAALDVLNRMPSAQQEEILSGLSNEALNNFIEGAMIGQKEVPSFRDAINIGIYVNSDDIKDQLTLQTFGGVEQLLELTAGQDLSHAPYWRESPFSEELQVEIFSAVTNGLNNNAAFANLEDNVGFKDAMSRAFIENGTDVLISQAPDGAFSDREFVTGMTKFFELALFSENGGELRGELMDSIILTMSDVGDASAAPPISQTAYENTHNGWSQQDHVEVMGGLMGMVWEAASNQKGAIQSDIAAREATTKLFIGMAFSFLPGAGDVIGTLAAEGANFFQKLPDEVISFGWEQGKDLLEGSARTVVTDIQGLSGREAIANVDKLMEQFANTLVATNAYLPNGEEGELNLRTAFQSAFSFYKNLVDLP